jgi:hypothetical protein
MPPSPEQMPVPAISAPVASATTGTDHIDKDELARRGIRLLCIAKDFGLLNTFTATAECAWLLVLAIVLLAIPADLFLTPFADAYLSARPFAERIVQRVQPQHRAVALAFRPQHRLAPARPAAEVVPPRGLKGASATRAGSKGMPASRKACRSLSLLCMKICGVAYAVTRLKLGNVE